jgi:hypothetical protein
MLSALWQRIKERYQGTDPLYVQESQKALLFAQQELESISQSERALKKA